MGRFSLLHLDGLCLRERRLRKVIEFKVHSIVFFLSCEKCCWFGEQCFNRFFFFMFSGDKLTPEGLIFKVLDLENNYFNFQLSTGELCFLKLFPHEIEFKSCPSLPSITGVVDSLEFAFLQAQELLKHLPGNFIAN